MTRRSILTRFCSAILLASVPLRGQTREEIRDRQGRLLGTIIKQRNGLREARSRQGRLLGTFNPRASETRDPQGRLLTKGDSLSSLVVESARSGPGKAKRSD
jgi:hypothetical protein